MRPVIPAMTWVVMGMHGATSLRRLEIPFGKELLSIILPHAGWELGYEKPQTQMISGSGCSPAPG